MKSPDITPDLAKFTFLCRSRMINVGANYKQGKKNPICPLCKLASENDTQKHLMWCTELNDNIVATKNIPEYDNLFKSSLNKKIAVVKILKENLKQRNKILEKEKQNNPVLVIGPAEPGRVSL